jgi:hypothetical protein
MTTDIRYCVNCRKEATTGLGIVAEPTFAIAFVSIRTGLSIEAAEALVKRYWQEGMGIEPGNAPAGQSRYILCLCPDCAAAAGSEVGDISDWDSNLILYRQGTSTSSEPATAEAR